MIRKRAALLLASLTTAIGGHTAQAQAYRVQAQPTAIHVTHRDGKATASGDAVFQLPDHFVWGASVIQGDHGRYYMIFSAPPTGQHPFNTAWVLGSKLGVAVSDRPDGGFHLLGFIMNPDGFRPDPSAWDAQTVMNPHVRKFGGKYYLYYVGGIDLGNQHIQSADGTLPLRDRIQQSLQIGVIAFDNFEDLLAGRFEPSGSPLLSPRTRVKPGNIANPSPEGTAARPDNIIVVNPSVVYRPADGKYLLYFKGNVYDPTWRGVHGVALSDSPAGPFVALDREVLTIRGGSKQLSAEDPYVWYSSRDSCFYAVFKDFTGAFTRGEPCLAVMRSADGIDWEQPEDPLFMKKQLVLPGGEALKVSRLERPQLLIDRDGVPQVLYSACAVEEVNPRTDGGSFNVQIRLTPQP